MTRKFDSINYFFSDIQIIDSLYDENFCNAISFHNHPQVGMALDGEEDQDKKYEEGK